MFNGEAEGLVNFRAEDFFFYLIILCKRSFCFTLTNSRTLFKIRNQNSRKQFYMFFFTQTTFFFLFGNSILLFYWRKPIFFQAWDFSEEVILDDTQWWKLCWHTLKILCLPWKFLAYPESSLVIPWKFLGHTLKVPCSYPKTSLHTLKILSILSLRIILNDPPLLISSFYKSSKKASFFSFFLYC